MKNYLLNHLSAAFADVLQKHYGWLLLFMALMIMPAGAWAQNFHWPDEASARYADVSRFTVSEVDGQTVLTGHCLAGTEMSFKLKTASGTNATATYSSSNTDVADRNTNSYTSSVEELVIKGAGTTTITATLSGDYTPNTYSYTLVITEIDTSYGINVYGTQVTSGNADNVLYDDYFNDGKITYDAENGELVLNNANIQDYQEPSIQFLGENLKVRLIGENRIYNPFSHEGGGTGTVTFLSDGGEENCLIFSYFTDDASTVTENYFIDCTVANTLNGSSGWQLANKAFNSNSPNYKEAYLYKQESTGEPATLYNIWIGETQITSNNASGVTGPGISGTVTFECDNSGSSTVYRLYLNNATLTVPIKTSVIFTNIYIEGDNSITSSSGPAIQGVKTNGLAQANLNVRIKESGTQATLHVKTTDGVSSVAKGFGSFLEVGSETYLLTSGPVDYDTSADSFEETYKYRITGKPVDDMTFTTVSTSQIWVAGQQVLYDQQSDILGDGTISYEYKTGYGSGVGRILTLNGFKMTDTYDGHAIIFGDDGVTNYVVVKYTGENVIRCTGYPFYTAHKSSWVNASFNPQSADDGNKITAYCDAPRISYNFYENTYNNYSGDGKKYGVYPIDGGHEVGVISPYGFSIGGTEIHERNLSYYEGLSYDADSHTITLDNATLDGELKWDIEANLTVLLKGSNSITGSIYTSKYDEELTLALVPTAGCSLTLDNSYKDFYVINSFSSLTYDGLACSVSDAVYKDGYLVDANGSMISNVTFTYQAASYGLIVAGVEVTSDNAAQILSPTWGSVSFDPATSTLTLNDASTIRISDKNTPFIKSSLETLKVYMVGSSSVVYEGAEGGWTAFVADSEDATIVFEADEENSLLQPLGINSNAGDDVPISAFSEEAPFKSVTYAGTSLYLHTTISQVNIKHLQKTGFNTAYNEEAVGFTLTKDSYSPDDVQYFYSIDYVNENLEDVTKAKFTFDYDEELQQYAPVYLEAPATITAWVEYGDAKSDEVVAKYFGFAKSEYTIKFDGSEYVDVPAIVPDYGENELNVSYNFNGEETVGTYDDESGKLLVRGVGSGQFSAYISDGDVAPSYTILNNPDSPSSTTLNVTADLVVAGIPVTDENRQNILREDMATVQFDGRQTLILNGAYLTGAITTTMPELTIYLKGSSSIKIENQETSGIMSQGGYLTFTTEGNTPGSLSIYVMEGCSAIDGAKLVQYEQNLTMLSGSEEKSQAEIGTPMQPIVDESSESETVEMKDIPDGKQNDLHNTTIANILYTLNQEEGDSYDNTEKYIVLTNAMGEQEVDDAVSSKVPGTDAFADSFAGLTFMVPAGTGKIVITAKTGTDGVMHVKIGNGEPQTASGATDFETFEFPFACTEATYVYVYNASQPSPAASREGWRPAGKKTTFTVGIKSVGVSADEVQPSNSETSMDTAEEKEAAASDVATTADGGLVIAGNDITMLPDNFFASYGYMKYIDLRKTKIAGLEVSRADGPFRGVSEHTFIYLPVGNKSEESNVVIGKVSRQVVLGTDEAFGLAADFTAQTVELNRSFAADKPATVYLPFAIKSADAAEMGIFQQFEKVENGFVKVGAATGDLTAHTPYLFTAKADDTQITAKGVVLSAAGEEPSAARRAPATATFYGCYEPFVASTDSHAFQLAADTDVTAPKFVRLEAGERVAPFSAYLVADTDADELTVTDDEQVILGITPLEADKADGEWYTLQGIRLQQKPTAKGIYILNGQQVVVR